MKNFWSLLGLLCLCLPLLAQHTVVSDTTTKKRFFHNQDKVLHAEPLYIDLIRDLGARKGEKEWNVGLGLTDNYQFDSYEALVEYEWAPMNNLGLEVELPFTLYSPIQGVPSDSIPSNQLNSVKVAAQYTFFTSKKWGTSMALGYINEFELADFRTFQQNTLRGNIYNPFLVVAKRWGESFHTLLYTGPRIEQHFYSENWNTEYDINFSMHYMIPHTRNFLGVEINQWSASGQSHVVFRPQMRLGISESTMIGIVAGIPTNRDIEGLSSFVRLIWEPTHK